MAQAGHFGCLVSAGAGVMPGASPGRPVISQPRHSYTAKMALTRHYDPRGSVTLTHGNTKPPCGSEGNRKANRSITTLTDVIEPAMCGRLSNRSPDTSNTAPARQVRCPAIVAAGGGRLNVQVSMRAPTSIAAPNAGSCVSKHSRPLRVIRNSPAQAFADLHLIVSKVLIPARRA
jgi:hypothetical protein